MIVVIHRHHYFLNLLLLSELFPIISLIAIIPSSILTCSPIYTYTHSSPVIPPILTAPECLLTDGYYGPGMDLWGAGCVMFEVTSLYPLFPGNNEMDQVRLCLPPSVCLFLSLSPLSLTWSLLPFPLWFSSSLPPTLYAYQRPSPSLPLPPTHTPLTPPPHSAHAKTAWPHP